MKNHNSWIIRNNLDFRPDRSGRIVTVGSPVSTEGQTGLHRHLVPELEIQRIYFDLLKLKGIVWLQNGWCSFLRFYFTEGSFVFVVCAVKTPLGQNRKSSAPIFFLPIVFCWLYPVCPTVPTGVWRVPGRYRRSDRLASGTVTRSW